VRKKRKLLRKKLRKNKGRKDFPFGKKETKLWVLRDAKKRPFFVLETKLCKICRGFVPDTLKKRGVFIFINETKVFEWDCRGRDFDVPKRKGVYFVMSASSRSNVLFFKYL